MTTPGTLSPAAWQRMARNVERAVNDLWAQGAATGYGRGWQSRYSTLIGVFQGTNALGMDDATKAAALYGEHVAPTLDAARNKMLSGLDGAIQSEVMDFISYTGGTTTPPEMIRSVTARAQQSILHDWNVLTDDVRRAVGDSVQTSILTGQSTPEMARRLSAETQMPRWRSELISRTEYRSAQDDAFLASMKNAGVKTYVWNASADSCPVCAVLHGTVHKTEDEVGRHPNCRCALIPNLDTIDLPTPGDYYTPAQKLDMLPATAQQWATQGTTAQALSHYDLANLLMVRENPKWKPNYVLPSQPPNLATQAYAQAVAAPPKMPPRLSAVDGVPASPTPQPLPAAATVPKTSTPKKTAATKPTKDPADMTGEELMAEVVKLSAKKAPTAADTARLQAVQDAWVKLGNATKPKPKTKPTAKYPAQQQTLDKLDTDLNTPWAKNPPDAKTRLQVIQMQAHYDTLAKVPKYPEATQQWAQITQTGQKIKFYEKNLAGASQLEKQTLLNLYKAHDELTGTNYYAPKAKSLADEMAEATKTSKPPATGPPTTKASSTATPSHYSLTQTRQPRKRSARQTTYTQRDDGQWVDSKSGAVVRDPDAIAALERAKEFDPIDKWQGQPAPKKPRILETDSADMAKAKMEQYYAEHADWRIANGYGDAHVQGVGGRRMLDYDDQLNTPGSAGWTDDMVGATKQYTASNYRDINGQLRRQRGKVNNTSASTRRTVSNLDDGFDSVTLGDDLLLQRGTDWREFGISKAPGYNINGPNPFWDELPGSTFTNWAYTSAAANGGGFTGPVRLIIRPNAATRGLDVDQVSSNRGELEVLLDRGQRYFVHRVSKFADDEPGVAVEVEIIDSNIPLSVYDGLRPLPTNRPWNWSRLQDG